MPKFANIKTVYAPDEKLSPADINRAIRFSMASEFETIQVYQQIMESTDNQNVKAVLTDITHDEMHHAGALFKLLQTLSPEDTQQMDKGMQEALQNMGMSGN